MSDKQINQENSASASVVNDSDQTKNGGNTVSNLSNLDVVLNIPVNVSLELGRTNVDLQSLIDLNQGSVIELNRLVDEPVDVLVNGCLVAKAEVVVVENKFGARITNIVSPEKRVENLNKKES